MPTNKIGDRKINDPYTEIANGIVCYRRKEGTPR
jgi:hypothetical protein